MSGIHPSRRELLLSSAAVATGSALAGTASGRDRAVCPEAADGILGRAFLRLTEGLVHYRYSGSPVQRARLPLYLAHAGPGSSRAFEPLLPALARSRFAFAPDMLGNGDSAPPARDDIGIDYYVDCAIRIMDVLGLETVDFYGSHTGAQIGCQLAVRHPRRVRRLVLDGIPLFPPEFKQQLLARYAPRMTPDDFGGHLSWAWNFVRDQSQFWPYFARQPGNRLANAVAPAAQLHRSVVDVLKALDTYHIAYRAAFAQDVHALLPQVSCPVLIMASERDPLSRYLDDAAALLPKARKHLLRRDAAPSERVDLVTEFLEG